MMDCIRIFLSFHAECSMFLKACAFTLAAVIFWQSVTSVKLHSRLIAVQLHSSATWWVERFCYKA